jgi:hypothetical protein
MIFFSLEEQAREPVKHGFHNNFNNFQISLKGSVQPD